MPTHRIALLVFVMTSASALAQGGLLSLLGQTSQQTASNPQTATATGTASGFSLPSLDSLRNLLHVPKVDISDSERAALDRLKSTLWSLAGPNERFDYGDLDDIVSQLSGELGDRVNQEISRRAADAASQGIFPRIRARIVNRVVSNNYDSYFAQGMQEANGRVRSGLEQFLSETGCTVNVPDRCSESRRLTLAGLEQFGQDALVLRTIGDRAAALGLPRFTFPNGMGWRDIDAIEKSLPPPNGVMRTGQSSD